MQTAMTRFSVQELGPRTWPEFVRVAEKHNGVWGGCWCVSLHNPKGFYGPGSAARNRALKETLVMTNRTHNILVYDGDQAVGWCLFGPPAEIPGRMSSYKDLDIDFPDWRIPCFFVDRDRRKEGVAKAALAGALRIIASRGGGIVDGYPISTHGKPYGSGFLWGGTDSMFKEVGFHQVGRLGKTKVVMRKTVRAR